MKFKHFTHTVQKLLLGACVAFGFGMLAASCSDDEVAVEQRAFDPNQPVVITGFTPESGSYLEEIVIYGSNFGTEKSNVDLRIGGRKATVVTVMNDKLFAFIPGGAWEGTIELTITDADGNSSSTTASKKLNYSTGEAVVSTLCGYQNDDDSQGEIWGSFDICAGFKNEGCMTIDPTNPDIVYIVYDYGNFIQELNLATRETRRCMSQTKFGNKRLRNCAFTLDNKYMLVSTDRDDNGFKTTSLWIVTRNSDGTFDDSSSAQQLASYKQCNGVAVHPVNGEVYFNSYSNGELFRLDLNDYFRAIRGEVDEQGNKYTWTGYKDNGCFRELFKIMDPSYEFNITIHPSGDYAYLVVINRHYILRTDYDWEKKEFTTPYVIAGSNGMADWVDAAGNNARVNRPYQGIFVKNPEYERLGRPDVYDFYFCDNKNFCVRYITPEGIVRTYAGRAPSTNGNIWGTEDGGLRTQARFRDVSGICFDERLDRFYVLDNNNRRVRQIGEERPEDYMHDDAQETDTPDEGGEETDPETETSK